MGGCKIREDNVGSLLGAGVREQQVGAHLLMGRPLAGPIPPTNGLHEVLSQCPAEFWCF